ncbi:MAG: hypothetical protein F6K44_28935 [Moorea sp. SIO3E2]|nr:hypothetical protein [Moorena sp. SIO3E2]
MYSRITCPKSYYKVSLQLSACRVSANALRARYTEQLSACRVSAIE